MAAAFKGRDRGGTRDDGYSKARKPSKGKPKRRQRPTAARPPLPGPTLPAGPVPGPGGVGPMGGPAMPIFPGAP